MLVSLGTLYRAVMCIPGEGGRSSAARKVSRRGRGEGGASDTLCVRDLLKYYYHILNDIKNKNIQSRLEKTMPWMCYAILPHTFVEKTKKILKIC